MDSVRIYVRIQPRASRNEIVRQEGDVWWIRLTAPPVEGKANAALLDHLSQVLGLSKSQINLVSGTTGRQKTVAVEGLPEAEVHRRLHEALAQGGTGATKK
ncbi:MAG: DUF167 domain-containing protein [Dehalococcoidia bacterium]|nr:DUF167 domain-containing protein [Dehalococcoidia bacterium]